jgi:alanyl-tRNA synthetase
LKAAQIRESFLTFFEKHNHRRVPSSSLIPHDDPTLLFINAGMNQFKDVFLGQRQLPYKRAVSSQKCIRAGGKHNDLENVGQTARHHTFFEMLGNFSFGDYFKEEAIKYCWDWVRNELKLPAERLYASVYEEDDEAFSLWEKIAPELKNGRIHRFGEKDNFWAMGATGPCGPCSELHFDRGEKYGTGPEDVLNGEGDRFTEIWNLVFMQFDRDENGKLTPLPKPSVDTGAGLERLAMVLQDTPSDYETDLFMPLITAIETITSKEYHDDQRGISHRVIADHVRALSFAFADGAVPSNEGRGYVLRRILRRAARHGRLLGYEQPFIYRLTSVLVDKMGEAFPELKAQAEHVALVIKSEEENFGQTLDRGIELFEKVAGEVESAGGRVIPGDEVFKLYDTYGFPVDLTAVMARERGLTIDESAFAAELEQQRERSKSGSQFAATFEGSYPETDFVGYNDCFSTSAKITYANRRNGVVEITLDRTPFYGEAGGQIGDTGEITVDSESLAVTDTKKVGDSAVHLVEGYEGDPKRLEGKSATVRVDAVRQKHTQRNHTATHLLHKALRTVLGEHVQQSGSLVAPDRLRFDFSHFKQVTAAELREIERLVNEQILADKPVNWKVVPLETAKREGAMMLFGEKYGDEVRLVEVEDYSSELCGGTHVQRTGEIGLFVIVSESAIAAGMRRIEAVTGEGALRYLNERRETVDHLVQTLKTAPEDVVDKVEELLAETKAARKELEKTKAQAASSNIAEMFDQAESVNGVKLLIGRFESRDQLNAFADHTRDRKDSAIGVFYSDKNQYAVTTSTPAIEQGLSARAIIRHLNEATGGRGGGREYFTQGGTSQPLSEADIRELVLPLIKRESK